MLYNKAAHINARVFYQTNKPEKNLCKWGVGIRDSK